MSRSEGQLLLKLVASTGSAAHRATVLQGERLTTGAGKHKAVCDAGQNVPGQRSNFLKGRSGSRWLGCMFPGLVITV